MPTEDWKLKTEKWIIQSENPADVVDRIFALVENASVLPPESFCLAFWVQCGDIRFCNPRPLKTCPRHVFLTRTFESTILLLVCIMDYREYPVGTPDNPWWRMLDSNQWPPACEAGALTSWANPPVLVLTKSAEALRTSFGGDCWTRTSDLLHVKQAL